MSADTMIHLVFRYTERDYARAMRAHYASYLRLRLDIAVTMALLGFGIYLWRSPSQHWLALTSIIVSVVFASLLVAAFTVIPRWVFRRESKLHDDYSLTFSPEGIHFRTAHLDSRLQWSIYSRALIDAHSYILYSGERQFSVLPKRVFESDEQREAFEQLLAQKVSQISR